MLPQAAPNLLLKPRLLPQLNLARTLPSPRPGTPQMTLKKIRIFKIFPTSSSLTMKTPRGRGKKEEDSASKQDDARGSSAVMYVQLLDNAHHQSQTYNLSRLDPARL